MRSVILRRSEPVVMINPVAIIGAGITGLTAAFTLRHSGIPVVVYEATDRVGGAIRSLRQDGYLAEYGPNTILETSPKITQLIRDLGLESRRLEPDPKAEARYLVRSGKPVAMPSSPLGFLSTDLFSPAAKLAVLREPFLPRRTSEGEESVADFVTRRLGCEFLDRAIDAMVAGVYAGDPHRLSVKEAFPKLAELEARYGSLIRGSLLGARERKKRGEIAKDRAPKFSFDEGLQVLTDALAEDLGERVRLNTSITQIRRVGEEWHLALRSGDQEFSVEHSAMIYAGTAHKLAAMNMDVGSEPLDLSPFSEIRYPPVASLVLGFRREDVAHPCQGFGVLIPKIEGFSILGTIFSSSLFPNRAPAGHLTLTSYIGGERHPELALLPPEEITALVQHDLERLLGVRGEPTFRHLAIHPKAIPQYNIGYGRYRKLMEEIEAVSPHFYFAGQYRDGISLSDSILSGCKIAERVASTVRLLTS
jgi:protoporphyrinogen/coproporphyrinogen III oxidase